MKRLSFHAANGLLILLVALAVPTSLHAQNRRGGIRLGLGGVRHGQTDLMASPFRYRGTALHVAAGYGRVGVGSRFDITASYSAVLLTSRITDLPAAPATGEESAYLAALRVRWLRQAAHRGRWQAFLGGQTAVALPVRRHRYFEEAVTELFGDLFVSFQAAGAHEVRVTGRTVLWQSLAVPVAGVVLRSPYTGLKYFPSVALALPGGLVGFDHSFGLDHTLGPALSVRAEWRTSALRYQEPREISMVTHRLELALEVRP